MYHSEQDLIIIGGGAMGTFHAYHALGQKLSVQLFEKDSQSNSSSVRNFGQVVPSGMKRGYWHGIGVRTTEIYKSLQARSDFGIRENGSTYIAETVSELKVLEETAAYYTTIGYPNQLLSKSEVIERLPALKKEYVSGALFFPGEVSAEPKLLVGQVQNFLSSNMGLKIERNCPVVGIESGSNGLTVQDAYRRKHRAKVVLIANGPEFKLLFPEVFLNSGLKMVKLNMMATKPLPEIGLKGNILTGLTIRRYEAFTQSPAAEAFANENAQDPDLKKWGVHILFKQAIDGSIIIGDSHEYAGSSEAEKLGFDVNHHISEVIIKEAKRIVNLPDWQMNSYWAGYYAQHETADVLTGSLEPGLFYASGIGGKGMTTCAGFAEENLNRILA